MKPVIEKIKGTPLNRLKNAKHAAFGKKIVDSFSAYPIIEELFGHYTELVRSAYNKEDELYKPVLRPLLTSQKNRDDSKRINAFYLLRDSIKAATRLTDADKKLAAENLYKVTTKYGASRIANLTVGERNGLLHNFIQDLKGLFRREVELLNLGSLVENLEAANEQYNEAEDKRINLDTVYREESLLEARNNTDAAIHLLFSVVNNAAKGGEYDELSPFINHTNAIIAEYTYGLGNNSSSTTKPVAPGEVEEKKYRYADFMVGEELFGRERCEVGKAIPKSKIPEAPEGMKWEGIPAKMPDEDIVILAVPKNQQPQDFTEEQLREFPIYPSQYGAVTEITNPNSLISPFNPLSINYKLSNLLPGTPAPTEGEVPAGKAKVEFKREAEEEERKKEERLLRRERRLDNLDVLEKRDSENSEDSALLDTKSTDYRRVSAALGEAQSSLASHSLARDFCLWYDLGSSVRTQGFVPECLTGFHWDIQQIDYVLDTAHHTIRLVKDEDENEDQGGELTLTPGMDWPFDVPAPEGWTIVKFVDKNGRETVKLYRNGSSVYTQGGYPENAPGYEWIGIHAILNGSTHTITEYEE